MLAYAAQDTRAARREGSPKALTLIVAGHAALIAVVMTAKMDVTRMLPVDPTDIVNIPIDPPPPAPPEPQPQPQLPVQRQPQPIPQPPLIDNPTTIVDM